MTTPIQSRTSPTAFDLYKMGTLSGRDHSAFRHPSVRSNRTVRVTTAPVAKSSALKKQSSSVLTVTEGQGRGVRRTPTSYSTSRHAGSKTFFSVRNLLITLLIAVSIFAVILPATTAFGGRSLVSTERQSAEKSNSVKTVVVQQGDTLWSIARKLEPGSDPRKVVDQLVQARGTANVYIGETIEWTK